jgi:hypothetical protein
MGRFAVKISFLIFLIIFFCSLPGCSLNVDEEKEAEVFLFNQGASGKILQAVKVGSFKDPGVEFVFEKDESGFYFMKKDWLNVSESDDLEYYSARFRQKFNVRKIDEGYYLLRGELSFGKAMCMKSPCSIYVLESSKSNIVYVAIYNQ